jgi:TRAP-type uncharacterized transport system substrate-binding protein
MQREQWQSIAIVAGLTAVVVAIVTGKLPRWLRVALVTGLVALVAGGGLYAYRFYTHPVTLTVAAGSFDGDAPQLMSALAAKLASTGSLVRLKVIEKDTELDAAKALSSGEADLALARADSDGLFDAETIVVVTHGVVLIVVPPGSSIASMDDLKGKTVGVVLGATNHKVVDALTQEYDPDHSQIRFKDLAVADIAPALKAKQVNALLIVMPISEKYLALLRNLFPKNARQKMGLIPIESAGAIAAVARYYHSYDLPKGTLQGSPPIPDDDMTTLRVAFYLVANKKLSNDVVASLAKAIMDTRRDLSGQYPLLEQISPPDTDKTDADNDTYIPIHPGADAYFSGSVQSFFDKYGDQIFYGSMLLGTLTSLFAGAWKFMTRGEKIPEQSPLIRLYALTGDIGKAIDENELAATEQRIDDILKGELEKYASGDAEVTETAALGLATHRLEHLIAQRRAVLKEKNA